MIGAIIGAITGVLIVAMLHRQIRLDEIEERIDDLSDKVDKLIKREENTNENL